MLEEMGVLYRGLVLGLVIAAPVGPVGLLCIRRTLQKGLLIGLATGLGAAFADALFGAVAVLGISAILDFIRQYESTIRLVGGLVVLGAAGHTWRDHPRPKEQPEIINKAVNLASPRALRGTARAGLSGLIITLTNPMTLFGTLAVVATFGAVTKQLEATVLIGGILSGSALWWLLLSGGVSLLRRHFTDQRLITVNRITAVMLALLAGWAILSGIHGYLG